MTIFNINMYICMLCDIKVNVYTSRELETKVHILLYQINDFTELHQHAYEVTHDTCNV